MLVIDDSVAARRLLVSRLSVESLDIHCVDNAAEGLLEAARLRPSLILLDLDMPRVDGFEALRLLKADPATSGIPVIILSGSGAAADKVMGLEIGAVDYICKPFDYYELVARVRCALRTQRLVEMLAMRAQIDGLTGLWNRAHFDRRIAETLAACERRGAPVSLAMADLDRFKTVNDQFGHPAGDAVLQGFADVLNAMLRRSDTAFRYGGEEFAVLLPDTSAEQAAATIERVRLEFAGRKWANHPERRVTASFGVAAASQAGGYDAETLVRGADRALYAAKQGGRNRVVVDGGAEAPLAAAG